MKWLLRALFASLAVTAGWSAMARAGDWSEGRRIYVEVCAACHTNGVAGAPRYGNRQEWEMRLQRSRGDIMLSVLKGKGSMPPKGGNPSVTNAQAAAATEYILAGVR